jgi:hypothetical protein
MNPSSWEQMPPEVRHAVTERQANNGFSDIDGLHEYLEKIWADYKASRATTGRISQRLKESFKEARERALMAKALIEVMGDSIQDIALGNTALFDAKLQEILPYLEISPDEIESMTPQQKIAMFKEIGTASSRMARNYKALKDEKRADAIHRAELQKGNTDEHKRALLEKMKLLVEQEEEGDGNGTAT